MSPDSTVPVPKFQLGQIVATRNALSRLTHEDIWTGLTRHARGDWGDLDEEDWERNEQALRDETRLFSAYHAKTGQKLWIITEWDRSVTTVLLPEDY